MERTFLRCFSNELQLNTFRHTLLIIRTFLSYAQTTSCGIFSTLSWGEQAKKCTFGGLNNTPRSSLSTVFINRNVCKIKSQCNWLLNLMVQTDHHYGNISLKNIHFHYFIQSKMSSFQHVYKNINQQQNNWEKNMKKKHYFLMRDIFALFSPSHKLKLYMYVMVLQHFWELTFAPLLVLHPFWELSSLPWCCSSHCRNYLRPLLSYPF